jgi:PAS domain S-box-containing protein
MIFERYRKWRNTYYIAVAALTILSLLVGTLIFHKEKKDVIAKKVHELETISNLKSKQVTEWYKDEVNDALIISQSSMLLSLISDGLTNKSFRSKDFDENIIQLASQHDYQEIIIAEDDGNVLYTSGDDDFVPGKMHYSIEQFSITYSPLVTSSGIYFTPDGRPSLDFVTHPKVMGKKLKLILRINPQSYLYHLMSYSFVDESSFRSGLIEFSDDSLKVIYSSGLIERYESDHKYVTNQLYQIKNRLTNRVFKARDTSGTLVMAYLYPINGTPWSLYSRVDHQELLVNFHQQALFIILLIVFIFIMILTVISLVYFQQQKEGYKSLYHMFADSPQPMWIYDLETLNFLEVNHAAVLHYGYTRQEFLSMSIKDIRPTEDIPKLLNNVATTVNPYNDSGIWRHVKKNGELIYVNIKSHYVEYAKRKARHVMAIDITDIKKAQDALRESEQKFRHLFEEHSAAKIIIDADNGKIADANEAAATFYGYTRDQLTNMNISELNTLDQEALEQDFRKVLERKKVNFEFVHRKKNGDLVDVEVFSSRIFISDKYYIHSIIHDISEKKKAKEQIENMVAELLAAKTRAEESDHLKTAFLANMSHEIRTPMNGILGFMDLLRQPDLSGKQIDEYISIVKTSGERLLNTINDIIDISKIESGQVYLHETHVDVNDILEQQYKSFKLEAENKGLAISVDGKLSQDEKLIKVDNVKLHSILANLIKNAIKFTKSGYIKFGVSKVDDNLVFTVVDTGKGIPPERKRIIFERFVQADVSIARDYEGSGLGLAITKAFIEMMGGQISVESELGKGSVFAFNIPYKPAEVVQSKENTPTKKDDLCKLPNNLTILIAEDDEISFIYLSRILRKYKLNLIRAYNGEEAVQECLRNEDISLVLMDIKMPIMDGYEATRVILSMKPEIPIVALTAYALSDDKEKAINSGCCHYLSKPVNKELLVDVINKYSIKKAIG